MAAVIRRSIRAKTEISGSEKHSECVQIEGKNKIFSATYSPPPLSHLPPTAVSSPRSGVGFDSVACFSTGRIPSELHVGWRKRCPRETRFSSIAEPSSRLPPVSNMDSGKDSAWPGKGTMDAEGPITQVQPQYPDNGYDVDYEKYGASRESNPLPELKRKLKSRHLQMIAIGESSRVLEELPPGKEKKNVHTHAPAQVVLSAQVSSSEAARQSQRPVPSAPSSRIYSSEPSSTRS